MTNHNPTITSAAATGSFSEDANTTGSTVDHVLSGTMNFTDSDRTDTHTTTTALKTAVWSGGSTLPSGALTKFQAGLTSSIVSDSNGSGKLKWTFSEDDRDFDFLAKGETLVLTYEITLKDNHGGSTKQTVKITVTGTDDTPVFATTTGATLTEQANKTLSLSPDTAHIALQFTDVDLNNTGHKAELLSVSATGNTSGILPGSLGTAELKSFFDIDNVVKNAGSSNGVVNVTFSAPDLAFDYLAAGEQVKITYVVQIDDQKGGVSTQNVVITVNGTNDKPYYICGPECAQLAEDENVSAGGDLTASGDLLFTDLDLSDTHTVSTTVTATRSSGDPVPLTQAQLLAAFSTSLHDSTGHLLGDVEWDFAIDNADIQFLGEGETLTLTYTVKIADGSGGFDTQTVTIKIDGKNDLVVTDITTTATDTIAADFGQTVAAGNAITDSGDHGGDPSVTLSITAVNGQAANVGVPVSGAYGNLIIDDTGAYQYQANANFDPLQVGDNVTDEFEITITDSQGNTATKTLTFEVSGADDAPVITASIVAGSVTEDAGPSVVTNGGFESGDLTGWTTSGPGTISAEFTGTGGQYGDYAAKLGPTGTTSTLSQDMATTPGQHYTLIFSVAGDVEATSNHLVVTWDGAVVLDLSNNLSGGFTTYSFDVVGNASASSTSLQFSYVDDGIGLYIDQVQVNALSGPPTETADGNVSFTDIEVADTHTASFVPQDIGYVGTFTLDPITESSGSGSVAWHFTVDNDDIQFLAAGETLTQTYQVTITGNHGAATTQSVTVTINGTNDAPTAVGNDHVVTNAGVNGGILLPHWVLTANDVDPDTNDTLLVNDITATSGSDAFLFGAGPIWIDDGTLGGSFDYNTTDGRAVSSGTGTVTVDNLAAGTTTLNGGSGDDIIVAVDGGETLNGAGGNDILIGNGSGTLTGGSGDDIFAFIVESDQTPTPAVTITDFNNTTDADVLAISAGAFGGGLTVGMDASFVFESSSDDQFISDISRFHYDESSQILYFSADGTTASAKVVAQLQSGVLLHGNDLLIV